MVTPPQWLDNLANHAGQAQQVVVNHRPRSALLSLSPAMLEKFAGNPLAEHWDSFMPTDSAAQ